jgi:hypothetical protein
MIACPNCGSTKKRTVVTMYRIGEKIHRRCKCGRCGAIYRTEEAGETLLMDAPVQVRKDEFRKRAGWIVGQADEYFLFVKRWGGPSCSKLFPPHHSGMQVAIRVDDEPGPPRCGPAARLAVVLPRERRPFVTRRDEPTSSPAPKPLRLRASASRR